MFLYTFFLIFLDGFRKRTPIERSSLARAESDQDHLEFIHPKFIRNHPELLIEIKRKNPPSKPSTSHQNNNNNVQGSHFNSSLAQQQPAKDLSVVFDELRHLRERQKTMEIKMNEIMK